MKFTTRDGEYSLKVRIEDITPELEAHPDAVASKLLSELSSSELSAALGRMRRNEAKLKHRRCKTSASLCQVKDGAEVEVYFATAINSHEDQFDAPRGRREVFEKIKTMCDQTHGGWFNDRDLRAMSVAFYNRYPKSRPTTSN